MMRQILNFEWKRCIRGKEFKMALVLSCVLALGHFFTFCIWYVDHSMGGVIDDVNRSLMITHPDATTVYPYSLYEGFIGNEGITFWNELYYYMIPVLAALPFSASFFEDERSGYLKNMLTRVPKGKVWTAKAIVTFCSGAITGSAAYIFSFWLNSLELPMIHPNEVAMHTHVIDKMSMSDWYYTKPWLYFGIYLVVLMLGSGFMALCSLCVSFVAVNRLVIWTVPFMLFYFWDFYCREIGKSQYSLFCLLDPARSEDKYYLSVTQIFALLIAQIFLSLIVYKILTKYRNKII